jgi:hypothetical protein
MNLKAILTSIGVSIAALAIYDQVVKPNLPRFMV